MLMVMLANCGKLLCLLLITATSLHRQGPLSSLTSMLVFDGTANVTKTRAASTNVTDNMLAEMVGDNMTADRVLPSNVTPTLLSNVAQKRAASTNITDHMIAEMVGDNMTADWILPSDHVRPLNSSLQASLWPQFSTKLGAWEPLLHRRPVDGHPFLLMLMVSQVGWMDLAVNFIFTLRQQGIMNVTISTNDHEVLAVAQALNISTYWTAPVLAKAPALFEPLPHWTWGKDFWLRVAITLHAIRQGVGSCHFDVDTAIRDDVFFSHPDGPFDMVMQGRDMPHTAESNKNHCSMIWVVERTFGLDRQLYLNPGFGCFASNERTAMLFEGWKKAIALSLIEEVFGWLQPAFNVAACEGDMFIKNCTATECQLELPRYKNMSMLTFRASSENDSAGPRLRAVHAKGCHGLSNIDMGKPAIRHKCKIETLKAHKVWYAPFDLPVTAEGWRNHSMLERVTEWLYSI